MCVRELRKVQITADVVIISPDCPPFGDHIRHAESVVAGVGKLDS